MSGPGLWDKVDGPRPKLADRFVVPPVSTLHTTSGEWLARRRQWLTLGIESELGRDLTSDRTAFHHSDHFDRGAGAARRRSTGLTGHGPNSAVSKMTRARYALPMTGGAGQVNRERYLGGKARGALDGIGDLEARPRNPNAEEGAPIGSNRRVAQDMADGVDPETAAGTSIFDPVLAECVYRWWTPDGGSVLDPFAGGSVRGLVAAYLGLDYTGIELRPEQDTANVSQAQRLQVAPLWVEGDALDLPSLLAPDYQCDMVFSCPPYYNLEVYSDDPRDLSTLPTYEEFLTLYRQIIVNSVARLRDDRFACYVVSDVRDKGGMYYGLHSDTIRAFMDAGLRLYNDAVLINSYGTLPLRVGLQFAAGRKLGRSHQNVVVFAKGRPEPRNWTLRMETQPPQPQLALWPDLGLVP